MAVLNPADQHVYFDIFHRQSTTFAITQMNSPVISQHDSPHPFEPLMPAEPWLAVAHIRTEALCESEIDRRCTATVG